jgi:hypothetical protein
MILEPESLTYYRVSIVGRISILTRYIGSVLLIVGWRSWFRPLLTWGSLLLYPLLPLEYWLLALETRPKVDVVELRCVALLLLLLLPLLPLGLVFDTPTVIGCVLQLTIGTLQLFLRHLEALGR